MSKKRQRSNKRPPIDISVLKRVISMLFHDYPVQIIIVFVSIALSAIIGAMPGVYIEQVTALIVDGLKEAGTTSPSQAWEAFYPEVIKVVLSMAGVFLAGVIFGLIRGLVMAGVTHGFLDKMRQRMFGKMQELPIKYFDTHSHGDIMSIYTNDIDTLRELISESIPSIISAVITLIFVISLMMYYSFSLMILVILGVIVMVKVTKYVGGNSAKYFIAQQKAVGKTEGFVEEMMNGQKVVKVFCHENQTKEDFDKINEELFKSSEKAHIFGNIFGPIMNNIGNMLYVLTAFVGGLFVISGGKLLNISIQNAIVTGTIAAPLTISVVAAYLGMTKQFTGNVNNASQQINSIAMALAGASRIFALLDQESETDEGYVTLVNVKNENGKITESPTHTGSWAWKHPHSADNSVTYTPLKGDVSFTNVDFSYDKDKQILKNITLEAEAGQKVAFVGATGAGKTTITNLINRFYEINEGKIRYDGINIRKIKKADLRRSLGIVLQETNLFNGTVMENIRYGRLEATDDECIAAAKLANAHDFIERLPDGYNTILAANGSNLSQGQRQLLSIARAAVADPPVMILDEATSSIDTRTEQLVQRGMDALMKGRTVFVIAHRLSTVRNSEKIMVLDNGEIIEQGSHNELISQKGMYYKLYTGAFELE